MARVFLTDDESVYVAEWTGSSQYKLVVNGSTCGLFRTVEDAKLAWRGLQLTPRHTWESGGPAQSESCRTII
jgi:hypothetical protein